MVQRNQRTKNKERVWLTSGVVLLLVCIFVISQLLLRYEMSKEMVSVANLEDEIELEPELKELILQYRELEQYGTDDHEAAVATMTYKALAAPWLKDPSEEEPEETEPIDEDGTMSGNNTSPTEETDSEGSDENGDETSGESESTDSDEGDNNLTDPSTPAPETPESETPSPETQSPETQSPETPEQENPTPETPSQETPAAETSDQESESSPNIAVVDVKTSDAAIALNKKALDGIMKLSDIQSPTEPGEGTEPESGSEPGTGTEPENGSEPGTGTEPENGSEPGTGIEPDADAEPGDDSEDQGSLSGNNTQNPTETPNGVEEVEVTLYFADLDSAIHAAEDLYVIKNKDLEEGEDPYIPRICLIADFTIESTLECSNPYRFTLDLNGHVMNFSETALINITNECVIDFVDDSESLGGMKTQGAYLFSGNGKLYFAKGVYMAPNGSIVKSASEVELYDGYYLFDLEKGFLEEGTAVLPIGKIFYPEVLTFRDEEIHLYILKEPDYMVVFGEMPGVTEEQETPVAPEADQNSDEEAVTYYATFEDAWVAAQKLSVKRELEQAKICIFNEQILRIELAQTMALEQGNISLSNLSLIRAQDFADPFFEIQSGELSLSSVQIDGTMYSETVFESTGPLLKVLGGKLFLSGTEEFPTTIQNNVAVVELDEQDPDHIYMRGAAGIYVNQGAKMYVEGCVQVENNHALCQVTEENPRGWEKNNLFMEQGVMLILLGEMTENAHIGVSYPFDVVAGITSFGIVDETYKEAFLATEIPDEERDLGEQEAQAEDIRSFYDGRLKAFTLDGPFYQAYYAVYNEITDELYWDKDQIVLPEAGVFRIEILLFVVAIYLLALMVLLMLIKKVPANRAMLIASISCLVLSIFISVFKIVNEKHLAKQNREVMSEIINTQQEMQQIRTIERTQPVKTVEVEESVEEKEEKKTLTVPTDGREYIGIVEIEELDLILPVLREYTAANMKTTPCVYYGTKEDNNLVIVGHNYDTQFGNLNSVQDGTEIHVKLTFIDGTEYRYTSVRREDLDPEDVDRMLSDNWDLTLFTCNYVGDKRITFRFKQD